MMNPSLLLAFAPLLGGTAYVQATGPDGSVPATLPLLATGLSPHGDGPVPATAPDGPVPSFSRDIRPLLAAKCFSCHGFDEDSRKGKLRLDTFEGATHSAIVPSKPGDSEFVYRITTDDTDDLMPPPDSGDPLTPKEVDLLQRWVAAGAPYEAHWGFSPPARPQPPQAGHPVDAFVRARLQSESLTPSPRADPRTLARRAALDLTGLPPNPELLATFLADTQHGAWERYVDTLLASPAYGEHWAKLWLDLGRYADTKGYEKDNHRNIWPWRDWLIQALNDDLPYDTFSTHLLAGDLLPDATDQTRLATAFHRNTLTNDEGGTDDEEFRVAAVKDRINTTVKVWMGLSMECAACHSHKYDPISISDYYRFYALFNQTEDRDLANDHPVLNVLTPEQAARRTQLTAHIDRKNAALETLIQSPKILDQLKKELAVDAWNTIVPNSLTAQHGTTFTAQQDGSWLASKGAPKHEVYTAIWTAPATPLTAVALETLPDPSHPRKSVGRSKNDGNFVVTGLVLSATLPDGSTETIPFSDARSDHAQNGYPVIHAIKNPGPKNKKGWAVSGGGTLLQNAHRAVFQLTQPRTFPKGTQLTLRIEQEFDFSYPGFSIGRLRLSESGTATPFRAAEVPGNLWMTAQAEKPDPALLTSWAAQRAGPKAQALQQDLAALKKQYDSLKPTAVPVMKELPSDKQRHTHIQLRGNFLDKGAQVSAGFPAAFHPLPDLAPTNRLGVATWLFDASNPLTARVGANRLWARLFGTGLVETEEDFGTQGTLPSHPELLDWLAAEYRDNGWSTKALLRTIVTSATYQQDSKVTPQTLERDPRNRLLARGSRIRLDAEAIRDASLATAGLLSAKSGGPSVMPHQPDGIWRTTYSTRKWTTSQGEDRFRRGLYTYIKRTAPYPAMLTFDGVSREICTVRRIRTNTPLQALVSMNDPVYLEAAKAMAEQSQSVKASWSRRIGQAWEKVLLRPATDREHARLFALFEQERAHYAAHPEAAKAFAGEHASPETAAMMMVCHTLLNLDEFLNRR